jgi:hypothetical protein
MRLLKSPAVVVPSMMILDLILGVSLSLYDSNLLRNVPGALASLLLICISRRWEVEYLARRHPPAHGNDKAVTSTTMTVLPSARSLRRHATPLAAVALAQAISASFTNRALQSIPLPLFKVCLMCGPIFVALVTSVLGGTTGVDYAGGRLLALGLIGAGAIRAVFAEAGSADDPRGVMAGAGCALGASAFSGMGLMLSGVRMHRREGGNEEGSEGDDVGGGAAAGGMSNGKANAVERDAELNPLSLLFYLSCMQVLMLGAYLCPWDVFSTHLGEAEGEVRIEKK